MHILYIGNGLLHNTKHFKKSDLILIEQKRIQKRCCHLFSFQATQVIVWTALPAAFHNELAANYPSISFHCWHSLSLLESDTASLLESAKGESSLYAGIQQTIVPLSLFLWRKAHSHVVRCWKVSAVRNRTFRSGRFRHGTFRSDYEILQKSYINAKSSRLIQSALPPSS